MLPKFGPMKVPEVDTPVAVNPDTGPSSAWATVAVNVVIPAVSTKISKPFKYDWLPVNPLSKNPSLMVGSLPTYVNVAMPYLRVYPVMLRVVVYV